MAPRTLILQKKWDDAIRECNLGLKLQPDNPDLLGLRRKASARGIQWAVVRNSKALVFDRSGRSIGSLSVGTLLNVHEIKKVPRDTLAYCTKPAETQSQPAFFVRLADLNVRSGPAADAPPELKDLASKQASLQADLEKLRTRKSSQLNQANPNARELETAKAERKAYWVKVEELKKKFDSASGDSRMKIHDQLRAMRGEDVRVEQRYEKARQQYDTWETAHLAVQEADSDLGAVEAELAKVGDAIARLEASP